MYLMFTFFVVYKKQRNKVNNMKKKANENFESNLDNLLLDNSTNPKTYWKIMKMLIKSNKGSNSFRWNTFPCYVQE
jgi:hypothetical protein